MARFDCPVFNQLVTNLPAWRLTMNEAESTTEVPTQPVEEASGQQTQPAPAAEEQKAPTDSDTTEEKAAQETPEQVEERRKQKAREHERRRLERARREATEAKTEARLLRERIEKLEAKAAPQESSEPQRDQYQDLEAYLEAKAEWKAEKKAVEVLSREREAQQGREHQGRAVETQERLAQDWSKRESVFQAATPDYMQSVEEFSEEFSRDFPMGTRMAVVESDVGPQLLYHLANNPDEAERISKLSPVRQIAELGKLEAQFAQPAKPSRAPAPIKPLGQGRAGTSDPSKMSDTEYKAWRKAQGARWAQ
ncbi:MAG: hypothetical protein WC100_05850 [Sterolibacterium sp.]